MIKEVSHLLGVVHLNCYIIEITSNHIFTNHIVGEVTNDRKLTENSGMYIFC